MQEIEITDEYRDFLIDSFSKSDFYFRIDKIKEEIYTKSIKDYEPLQLAINKYVIPTEYFEYFASLVVSTQNLQLRRDSFEKGSLKYDIAIYNRNRFNYEDYFEYCGIILKTDYFHVVAVKTQEQLNNIFYSIRNDTESYLQKNYYENFTEIEEKRNTLLMKQRKEIIENEKQQIKEKLLEKERKKHLQRDVEKELIEQGLIFNDRKNGETKREPIPKDIMNQVWNRDGGKCVQCGSQENLEFDHIIPFSKGGATTYRNLQLLCQKCNREKSNKI